MKWFHDNAVVLYCFFLFSLGMLFLGFEINEIQNTAKINHAQNIINNCNMIIAKESFQ